MILQVNTTQISLGPRQNTVVILAVTHHRDLTWLHSTNLCQSDQTTLILQCSGKGLAWPLFGPWRVFLFGQRSSHSSVQADFIAGAKVKKAGKSKGQGIEPSRKKISSSHFQSQKSILRRKNSKLS